MWQVYIDPVLSPRGFCLWHNGFSTRSTLKGIIVKATPNGWTKEKIVHLIDTNDKAVVRALITIYQRQTADEQSAESTSHSNGVGFGALDAQFLTSIAKKALKYPLTERQIAAVRKSIKKYWRQLLEVAANSPVKAPE